MLQPAASATIIPALHLTTNSYFKYISFPIANMQLNFIFVQKCKLMCIQNQIEIVFNDLWFEKRTMSQSLSPNFEGFRACQFCNSTHSSHTPGTTDMFAFQARGKSCKCTRSVRMYHRKSPNTRQSVYVCTGITWALKMQPKMSYWEQREMKNTPKYGQWHLNEHTDRFLIAVWCHTTTGFGKYEWKLNWLWANQFTLDFIIFCLSVEGRKRQNNWTKTKKPSVI